MSKTTLTFVFATERGTPTALTQHRTKAAVPFAGKYRVIDFSLTNALHSGLRQILVLTQYKSHSLHKHLRDAWSVFNPELGEFITPVPPQMRTDSGWYINVLDALRQNRYLIERNTAETILLLDGGLVYRMDYAALIRWHREQQAEVTVPLRQLTPESTASRVRIECNEQEQIVACNPNEMANKTAGLAPMGVVLINRDVLLNALDQGLNEISASTHEEFMTLLIEPLLAQQRVFGYQFGGERGRVTPDRYWSDLASLDAYYQANMALLAAQPPLDLYQPDWNILTNQGQYPPARTVPGEHSGNEGIFINSMLAAGTVIRGGGVSHSVLFPRVQVEDGAIVDGAVLCDGVQIGAGAELRRCILDKEVTVAPGARIGLDIQRDQQRFEVSPQGIVVITKGCHVAAD
ncbi:glucose-1-phosphate adenylyltransferase [Rhodoferax sp. 4810]|uniref:Glucose-1-phosphate adenylyltransferase n=1 Tax=Thiospirillum jenense TaxID=1653858 RepID=A0A839HDN8_9GAMM|nr:sugar phosphate nucleotidyltransferase [Thiospirillum jenense]MBB1074223.1 glucose-1-phosphate adenylyltransferase [Rhodoferax jenense]MBB1125297.1 glucose-1-phosphate adenylyltransferase [Thiospirillum jenense]